MEFVLGGIVIALALVLIVAVLMQSGKDTRLSGTIAGGAETFFGKAKATTMDRFLSRLTIVTAVIFAVLVIVIYAVFD